MMGYLGYGMGTYMWITIIMFWLGIILLVYWLIRLNTKKGTNGLTESDDPKDILDRRLAKGDISIKEYHEMRQLLN